jgi:hypothetical protein
MRKGKTKPPMPVPVEGEGQKSQPRQERKEEKDNNDIPLKIMPQLSPLRSIHHSLSLRVLVSVSDLVNVDA